MITRDEADRILAEAVSAVQGTEVIALADAAGRALAEDVHSDMDMPPFDRSAMDGFAVMTADVAQSPAVLDVVATIAAGSVWEGTLSSGQAARIMTGAPVPSGADRVIKVEDTELVEGASTEQVRILDASGDGTNIAPRGQDVRTGDLVLPSGTFIRPTEIGVLSSCGKAQIEVSRSVTVKVVATGDELLSPEDGPPAPGQIRESNGVMLTAEANSVGAAISASFLGIARDSAEDTDRFLNKGLDADVLILSGGVSMGEFDFVHHALHARGMEVLIEKVAIKPGKPFLFGRLPRVGGGVVDVFGLPGNPVSSLVTFELFVRPYLQACLGHNPPHRVETVARNAAVPRCRAIGRMQHLPSRVEMIDGCLTVRALDWHGSGDLRGLVGANGFIVLQPDEAPPQLDQEVDVWLLEPDLMGLPMTETNVR